MYSALLAFLNFYHCGVSTAHKNICKLYIHLQVTLGSKVKSDLRVENKFALYDSSNMMACVSSNMVT